MRPLHALGISWMHPQRLRYVPPAFEQAVADVEESFRGDEWHDCCDFDDVDDEEAASAAGIMADARR